MSGAGEDSSLAVADSLKQAIATDAGYHEGARSALISGIGRAAETQDVKWSLRSGGPQASSSDSTRRRISRMASPTAFSSRKAR